MDIIMVAVLIGSFALILLLTNWCEHQVDN